MAGSYLTQVLRNTPTGATSLIASDKGEPVAFPGFHRAPGPRIRGLVAALEKTRGLAPLVARVHARRQGLRRRRQPGRQDAGRLRPPGGSVLDPAGDLPQGQRRLSVLVESAAFQFLRRQVPDRGDRGGDPVRHGAPAGDPPTAGAGGPGHRARRARGRPRRRDRPARPHPARRAPARRRDPGGPRRARAGPHRRTSARQRRQDRLPGQYEPRAAHAAERRGRRLRPARQGTDHRARPPGWPSWSASISPWNRC